MRAHLLLRLLLCVAAWILPAIPVTAVEQLSGPATANSVKAAFLYKFASFVEWPTGAFHGADQPLVIAVSGDDEVAAELEQIVAGRTVEGRSIAVRRLPEVAAASDVHILFLGSRREHRLREALEAAAGPVLVVTDQSGGLRMGGVINFSADGGRVRFSASLACASARNLKLSARLLAVAQVVEGRNR